MKNNIISITSIREREFAYLWNMATPEQRLRCLAMYVHKYNDKKILELIMKRKCNDIEFQQFKREIKKYL